MTEHANELCNEYGCAVCDAARRGGEHVNPKYTLNTDRPERVRRPSYRDALYWIVMNDDITFLSHDENDGRGSMSIAACLVADMFDLSDERVRADLIRVAKKHNRL